MPNLDTVHLVIFDCDGVLVGSEPLSNRVLAHHASKLGWAMDAKTSQSIFKGMTMEQVHTRIEAELQASINDGWISRYYADSYDVFKTELKPVTGIEKLIERVLGAGKQICVASQGPHEKMSITLGATGLIDYFQNAIFSADDVARPKPFPDLFLTAAAHFNTRPENSVVIEDSLTGVKAARAANMPVFYLSPEKNDLSQNGTNIIHVYELEEIFP